MDQFSLEAQDNQRLLEFDSWLQKATACSTPLLYTRDKKSNINGIASSLYIEFDTKRYLITAGHAFQENNVENVSIHRVNFSLVDSEWGCIYLPSTKLDDFSEIDVAIFKINKKNLLEMDTKFIAQRLTMETKSFHPLWGFITGYPSSKNKFGYDERSVIAKYSTFRLPYYLKYNHYNYVFGLNMCYHFNIDNVISTKNIPKRKFNRAPYPMGMSGCGIWQSINYPIELTRPTLAGMITNYDHERSALVGFNIQPILSLIEEQELKMQDKHDIIFLNSIHNS